MNYLRYQWNSGGDQNNEFSRHLQTVTSNVKKISQYVTEMQPMVNQLGTDEESETLRSQLEQLLQNTNQLARDSNNYLKEMALLPQQVNPSEQKQQKLIRQRLTYDFMEELKNFAVIQRILAQKEKEILNRARAQTGINANPLGDGSTLGHSKLTDFQSFQSMLQMGEEYDLELLIDQEIAIHKIENDVMEVNQIFKDLAVMVYEHEEVTACVEDVPTQLQEGTQPISCLIL